MQKIKGRSLETNRLGYLLTIPASILILLVSIYPLINGILMGFEDYNLMRPNNRRFAGLENFRKLIFEDTEFHGVLGYSFLYTIMVVVMAYLFGLFLAMILNRNIKGRGVFRTVALLPWVVAPSVATTNWQWLLNDQIGYFNKTLQSLGIIDRPILFLAEPTLARFTVMLTGAWRNYPFMMIVILAGLQSIPRDLYESAHIDGAGFWKSFLHITMPMLRGVSTICVILTFIWTFNNFENIYLLTRGGPNNSTFVLPILTYYTAFFRSKISYASAIATFMLVILLAISLVYLRVLKANAKE